MVGFWEKFKKMEFTLFPIGFLHKRRVDTRVKQNINKNAQ